MPQLAPLQLFKLLSDDTRLNILLLLHETGELCVCDITTAIQEAQPKTSRHLAILRESGLLLDRREGKWIYYRISPHLSVWAANILEQASLCQFAEITQLTKRLQQGKGMC